MTTKDEKPLVLMVDDDGDFRSIVRGWVAAHYDFMGFEDGEDLLEALEDLEPDVILLDVRMPGPDGFNICARLRADSRFADIPILFMTGCKEDEDFVKNLDSGGTAFMTKPVERKRLLALLRELTQTAAFPA